MAETLYALSVKQPWAALIVHGLKRIEIRRWRTSRRGFILIHAASRPDRSAEAWNQVPAHLQAAAQIQGGIVGRVHLIGCREYRSAAAFASDVKYHLNHPSWFVPPVLYGFELADPVPLPFRPYPGWVRFFRVPEVES
jgi:hypothetical protein